MLVHQRSEWTSVIPRPVTLGDEFEGLPYYDEPPVGISFHVPNDEVLYTYRNPLIELERLRQQAVTGTGFSDIDYNYAVAPNTEGVYVLRGNITKCTKSSYIKVLLLKGNNEEPTDLLKKNQDDFINTELSNPYPVNPMRLGDSSVHVFNLIEFLAERGIYTNRNDGTYSEFVAHAVAKLQKDMGLVIDGSYNLWVINALESREYINPALSSAL